METTRNGLRRFVRKGRNLFEVDDVLGRLTQGSHGAATLGWRTKSRWDFQTAQIHLTASNSSAMPGGNWISRFSTESLPEMRRGRSRSRILTSDFVENSRVRIWSKIGRIIGLLYQGLRREQNVLFFHDVFVDVL